jgi:hypothetical protein
MKKKLVITPDGTLKFVYSDKLRRLLRIGKSQRKRASYVEPYREDEWIVDLSPYTGKPIILGPFDTREKAVQEEIIWLEKHLGEKK